MAGRTDLVTEKLRLLLVREREINSLRQRLHAHRAWMSRVQRITAAMSSASSVPEARDLLAASLVEESPYEFSVVIGEGSLVCRGHSLALDQLGTVLGVAERWWSSPTVDVLDLPATAMGDPSWILGGGVRSADPDRAALLVIVGRTHRTAGFYLPPWDTDVDHLGYLLETIAHVLSAVELRSAVTAERNNLQVEVDHATLRLRLALEDALTARQTAEAASRAKSTFLANMSHELRTPLNAIIGYSELLAEDHGHSETLQDLDRIRGAGRHLLALISDILDLSKIEAGRLELRLEPFDAAPLVRSVCSTMSALAMARANELVVEVPSTPLTMTSDETKFRQVLVNLLGNACKFTENGRIDVVLSERDGGVSLVVRDTGIGMGPQLLARLFEPFHQGDSAVVDRQGGTGLGLAISHQFCRILGGTMIVESSPGAGSKFEAWLPRIAH